MSDSQNPNMSFPTFSFDEDGANPKDKLYHAFHAFWKAKR